MMANHASLILSNSDFPKGASLAPGPIAWDVETSGLDWATDRLATCQIADSVGQVFVVRITSEVPLRLAELLSDPAEQKVFHHAMFDLRFLYAAWRVRPRNIVCTKIASKILSPINPDHSLKTLVKQHLGVEIEKKLSLSNWFSSELTPEQLSYAADDVVHLIPLYETLMCQLANIGRSDLALRCYDHIPTRVELDVGQFGDVYVY
jgi:ribonuclease D